MVVQEMITQTKVTQMMITKMKVTQTMASGEHHWKDDALGAL